jgi:hypothetical protein
VTGHVEATHHEGSAPELWFVGQSGQRWKIIAGFQDNVRGRAGCANMGVSIAEDMGLRFEDKL